MRQSDYRWLFHVTFLLTVFTRSQHSLVAAFAGPALPRHPAGNFNLRRQKIRNLDVRKFVPMRLSNESDEVDTVVNGKRPTELPSWATTVVFPLWLVYVSNQWSRFSFNYLVDFGASANAFKALNVDISLDQSQYAFLASAAFTSLFAVASLGAGVASDRFDRKTLTVVSVVTWSLATYGESLSTSYEQLVLCRVLMGLACAFSTPTAYTLIADLVPRSKQSIASSFYGTGVAIASGLSSLIILLDDAVGWRSALQTVAAFGVLSTATGVFLLPSDEKQRGNENSAGSETHEMSQISKIASFISIRRVQWLYLASFFRFCSGLCIGVWSAPFFQLVFPDSKSAYSITQAGISVVGATLSGLLGGVAADALSSAESPARDDRLLNLDPQGSALIVPIMGSLIAAPAWYLAVQTDQTFEVSMIWLAVEYFVAECWFGPTISCLQSTVPKGTGGAAQGFFTLTGALGNFAPSILGYLYTQSMDVNNDSSAELATLLVGSVCTGYLLSAICFMLAATAGPAIAFREKKTA